MAEYRVKPFLDLVAIKSSLKAGAQNFYMQIKVLYIQIRYRWIPLYFARVFKWGVRGDNLHQLTCSYIFLEKMLERMRGHATATNVEYAAEKLPQGGDKS